MVDHDIERQVKQAVNAVPLAHALNFTLTQDDETRNDGTEVTVICLETRIADTDNTYGTELVFDPDATTTHTFDAMATRAVEVLLTTVVDDMTETVERDPTPENSESNQRLLYDDYR